MQPRLAPFKKETYKKQRAFSVTTSFNPPSSQVTRKITVVDLRSQPSRYVEIAIPDCRVGNLQFAKDKGLLWPRSRIQSTLEAQLKNIEARSTALRKSSKKIDCIVFSELYVPAQCIPMLEKWSKKHNCIIIAGSHYRSKGNRHTSVCPIIFPNKTFYTEKLQPSPYELSPIEGEGLTAGSNIRIFKNTQIGNFAVLICSDYLDINVRQNVLSQDVQILFVVACSPSKAHHNQMHTDCMDSDNGLYIIYSCLHFGEHGDGASAIFGQIIDSSYRERLVERGFTPSETATDHWPHKTKVWHSSQNHNSISARFDIELRRAPRSKTVRTEPNITVHSLAEQKKYTPNHRCLPGHSASSFRLVAFDLDGTLLRFPRHVYSWSAVWEDLAGDTDGKSGRH